MNEYADNLATALDQRIRVLVEMRSWYREQGEMRQWMGEAASNRELLILLRLRGYARRIVRMTDRLIRAQEVRRTAAHDRNVERYEEERREARYIEEHIENNRWWWDNPEGDPTLNGAFR